MTFGLSRGMSAAVVPAALAVTLPLTAPPSSSSQVGPAYCRPMVLPSLIRAAIGSRNVHAPPLPARVLRAPNVRFPIES